MKRQQSQGRSATRAQAEDVVEILDKLDKIGGLPRFMIQSDDLPRVLPLLGAVSINDERGVNARLEALETNQNKTLDEMKKLVNKMNSSVQVNTRNNTAATVPKTTPIAVDTRRAYSNSKPSYLSVTAGAPNAPFDDQVGNVSPGFFNRPSRETQL